MQYWTPLYVHEQLEPTHFDAHVLPFASVHSLMHVGWLGPPVPEVVLPDVTLPVPPPEQIIGPGGTMPGQIPGPASPGLGGGSGVGFAHWDNLRAMPSHWGALGSLPLGPQRSGVVCKQTR
jgi:hypothetical protein